MYSEETKIYFKNKANAYDHVDKQLYWVLSDKILWHVLCRDVLSKLGPTFNFCDAGGGTGRWSLKILTNMHGSKGLTIDASTDMLFQAKKKKEENRYLKSRWEILNADLHHLESIQNDIFDLSFNFHNVLGFVEKPRKVLKELYRITKPGGYVISLVPNLYHAIYFNISIGRINAAKKALGGKGTFTDQMPAMHLFTIYSIERIMNDSGIYIDKMLGFPCLIYPGFSETQIDGQTEKLSHLLENEKSFNEIYQMELEMTKFTEVASRGNNIFVIGKVMK